VTYKDFKVGDYVRFKESGVQDVEGYIAEFTSTFRLCQVLCLKIEKINSSTSIWKVGTEIALYKSDFENGSAILIHRQYDEEIL
jgi:hypothetical protein